MTAYDYDYDYDYVIVGSGFGGSVAALRLREKGYSVLVLEAGSRFRDADFPKSSWRVRKFLFNPRLGLRGIMRIDVFRGLMVLSGAGVGGGSLVYANTLMEPSAEAFAGATWPRDVGVQDWRSELRGFYADARRILGARQAPTHFPAETALKRAAETMGYGDTLKAVDVGVYVGEPGVTVPDPYFDGDGPERTGCTFCGGCMIGCRNNAKNTLVKNYLYMAEKRGVEVKADAEVTALESMAGGGYVVTHVRPGLIRGRPSQVRARGVVLAAGVLGTLRLLLKCRDESRTLRDLSPMLGAEVRTNSESIIGVRVLGSTEDYSKGVAIAASINPDARTKIEAVRYPAGSDLLGVLQVPLVAGSGLPRRVWNLMKYAARNPLYLARTWWPLGFARETIILLVMQTLDSKLRFVWKGKKAFGRLTTDVKGSDKPPIHIPEGNAYADALAKTIGGVSGGSLSDVLGMSVTAHVLGGCPMGNDPATSVIDGEHRVHGHPGLYVVGGAAVPANLGVNPSLTITAMAERAMAKIPARARVRDGAAA